MNDSCIFVIFFHKPQEGETTFLVSILESLLHMIWNRKAQDLSFSLPFNNLVFPELSQGEWNLGPSGRAWSTCQSHESARLPCVHHFIASSLSLTCHPSSTFYDPQ